MNKGNLFFHYYPDRSPTFRKITEEFIGPQMNLATTGSSNSTFTEGQSQQYGARCLKSPLQYPPSPRLSFKSRNKTHKVSTLSDESPVNPHHFPKKKIRLEDRKQRSPYPDSRPKSISKGGYSICRVPSPSYIRSGVSGECKVSRLNASVSITEYGPMVRNNSFYSYQKFINRSRQRTSPPVNCKGEKIEFYNNQHSCFVLPPNQRLKRIVSSSNSGYPVHKIQCDILSPMDSRIQQNLLSSSKYQSIISPIRHIQVEESAVKFNKTTDTFSTFCETESININPSYKFNHSNSSSTLRDNFSNLSKLMKQSSIITSQLFNQSQMFKTQP